MWFCNKLIKIFVIATTTTMMVTIQTVGRKCLVIAGIKFFKNVCGKYVTGGMFKEEITKY